MLRRKIILIFLLATSPFATAKSSYRPPLIVDNIVSDEVRAFLKNSNKNTITKTTSNHDILGRKKTNFVYPTNYVIIPEETMEVDVAYLGNHKPSANISGRYEYQKDSKKILV